MAYLLQNKLVVLLLILVLLLASESSYILILRADKATLVAEKGNINNLLIGSQATVKQLQNDITLQNFAIDALKLEADVRMKKNADNLKKAQIIADTYKTQAGEILSRPAPVDVPKCDAANMLILEEIKNAHN